ncbi:MAG: AAA family ATPase [Brevinema sp.]
MYHALTNKSTVLIFTNIEKCDPLFINMIGELIETGECKLRERYINEYGNLIQVQGAMVKDSIDRLSIRNKFIIINSTLPVDNILKLFSSQVHSYINNHITLQDYSDENIYLIIEHILQNKLLYISRKLSFSIEYDSSFVNYLASQYKTKIGFIKIEEFIERDIYKALTEFILRNTNKTQNSSVLQYRDNTIYLCSTTKNFDLSHYLQKKQNSLQEVKEELNQIIGLQEVKEYVLNLETNLKIQQLREDAGHKKVSISKHMIFTGNPGTGKTTIARIVAKYLKAIGVLSEGQLVEVTRADLVAQYVGHTAKQTNDVISSAIEGVLFIDEAYALCRDSSDTFGLEAIDALVKGIEDNRDNLVVILAGYSKEMKDFLKTNSGLKSRFPNFIDFKDYSVSDLVAMSHVIASSKGYKIDKTILPQLTELYEKKQIKGNNDSGNGRLVRNIIEGAILQHSKRIALDHSQALDMLIQEDFAFENTSHFDLEEALSSIVGLKMVKDFLRTQQSYIFANQKRKKAGLDVSLSQSLNMIFSGNPGTGKTTIARILASALKEMGYLKKGQLIEVTRADLVAQYVGHTATRTNEIIQSALGGVLFVDEAYALCRDSSDTFGLEAIDALVKGMEDNRDNLVVVLAGYSKEMAEFLKTNSGLKSRFPLDIEFPDYSAEELYQIALILLQKNGFILRDESVLNALNENIQYLKKTSNTASGNGRMIRNLIEKIQRKQSVRIATNTISNPEELSTVLIEDIVDQKVAEHKHTFDLKEQLKNIIGLDEVKQYIQSLQARLRITQERKKLGITNDSTQTLHMIFTGNPGTGKTMMARTIADTLYNIGVISTNKLVEIDRSGLVAGYVGQTALKTTEVIQEALDGVLFIDEAYALSQGGPTDFGREAINTLVKLMDDYQDRLVVILAGYSTDMKDFLVMNPGLKSRFPNVIHFADYTPSELMQITCVMYKSKNYILIPQAESKLETLFTSAVTRPSFGNGRYVRNLLDKSINNQAHRLISDPDLTQESLLTIEEIDIQEVE